MNHNFLMNLPTHIILEVLSWLPAKTIFQCKSVCKLWHELISDPAFIKFHFSRARPGLVVQQCAMYGCSFSLVDIHDARDHHDIPHDTMLSFMSLRTLSSYHDANIVVDGSIDGFLFVRDINFRHETLYICNPLTREYFEIPKPARVARYPGIVTHGFGVTSGSGEYKVVRIFHNSILEYPRNGETSRVRQSECEVYTLGTGRAWRPVEPAPFAYSSRLLGLFFKGNIHWLVQDLEGCELISCFDLENEAFQPCPGPFPGKKLYGSLGVLRGCLSLCDNSSECKIDIWIMKEYRVEKSWVKEIAMAITPELIDLTNKIVQPLKIFRDGTILILFGDRLMFCCCSTESVVAKDVVIDQSIKGSNSAEALHYVPSFASLRRFVMENVIKF